jgi:type I restriction enzyme M protein
MQKLESNELKSFLWEAANILRGKIDSSDYKHYILGLLFYKRLSDNFKEDYQQMVREVGETVADNKDLYEGSRFYIPKGSRWEDIQNTSVDIGGKINEVFKEVTRANTPRLDGLLDKIDFNDKARLSGEVVTSLVNHFSAQNLAKSVVDGDILGDAYEYLIAQFADDAGKKGGEFYTPVRIVELLVKVLDPQEGESIHDPAVGSGGILVTAGKLLKESGHDPTKLQMSGQENIYNTYILARMNMILHGYTDARIRKGDTFREPQFIRSDGGLEQFDMVLANPPWNLKNWMHKTETVKGKKKTVEIEDPYNRLKYGRPPASSADWAWIQHMYAALKPKGRMGIVMDNGVLFRGSKEKAARKAFVEMDVIDTVVGLPSNLFANTGSPGCLVFIDKNKPDSRKNKILFIDASKDYLEGKAQNHLRPQDVEKTLNTYHEFSSKERYCTVADLKEIKENDYNLNISRYVDTTEPEEEVVIPKVLKSLDQLEKEKAEIDQKLKGYLKELGW